jgi:hypothetical protein
MGTLTFFQQEYIFEYGVWMVTHLFYAQLAIEGNVWNNDRGGDRTGEFRLGLNNDKSTG